jgi:outer membrane immunogenic protein
MRRGWSTLGWAFAFAVCSFCANAQTCSWNWTGFYVGADAGFVSSRSFSSTQAAVSATPYLLTTTPTPGANSPFAVFNANAVDTLNARGAEGGVHAGYNWQLKPFAVGLEIDYGAFRANAVRDTTFALSSITTGAGAAAMNTTVISQLHSETNTNWLFTVRPRIGWVYSVLYGYITGGAAFTSFTASARYSDVFLANGLISTSQSKVGWTMGAGLEVAIAPRWTLRAEYLRVEFSGVTGVGRITNGGALAAGVGGVGTFNPINLSADYKSDMVRVGVSHKFQWWFEEPVPPVAPGPIVVTKD